MKSFGRQTEAMPTLVSLQRLTGQWRMNASISEHPHRAMEMDAGTPKMSVQLPLGQQAGSTKQQHATCGHI